MTSTVDEKAMSDDAVSLEAQQRWVPVCRYDDLQPECGVTALVGDRQIAIFRIYEGSVYALDNQDPFTGAFVLGRGIVGDRNGIPTVASPLLKQVFDLRTGKCLDDSTVGAAVHPIRVRDGMVELAVT